MAKPKQVIVAPNDDLADEAAHHRIVDLTTETLTGDVRDFILDTLRYEQDKRPWNQRSESDQHETIHRVESRVHDVVRRAVEMIAAQGLRTIRATLEQVTIKDGIKGTITLSKFDEQRHALADATGSSILIVVADPEAFTGEQAPVEIALDQPDLPDVAVVHADTDKAFVN